MNTKLHTVADADGRPIRFFMTAGPLSAIPASPAGQRVSDYTGAAALLGSPPSAEWLLADRAVMQAGSEKL